MPVTTIDLDDGLASLLAGDLAPLDTDVARPNTPDTVEWGEAVRAAIQALIQRSNGEDPFPPGVVSPVLAQSAQPLTVLDTSTPTDLLSYSIPAGRLTTDHALRVRMGGTYVNNSASPRIYTVAITLGGTTLYQDGSASNGASALVMPWSLDFIVAAESNTVVNLYGSFRQHTTNAPDTGLGAMDQPSARVDAPISSAYGGVTVSSLATGARTLAVTFNHPTSNSTQRLVRTHYSVELL